MGLVEPVELLDESWFFGNLLHGKSRMLRSQFDPCPSSESTPDISLHEKSMEETYSSIMKIPEYKRTTRLNNSLNQQRQCGHLLGAPSLPTPGEMEDEFQDEESDFSLGKLIRQASLNHVKLQPRIPSVKCLTRSRSISTVPNRTQPENKNEEMKHRKLRIETLTSKSLYCFRIEKLQEKRRPKNSSEGWVAKSCGTSPTPFMNGGSAPKKSAQDLKAQIKFWARAVALNVSQEC